MVLIQFSWFRIQQQPVGTFETCIIFVPNSHHNSQNVIKLVTKNSSQFTQIPIWTGLKYVIASFWLHLHSHLLQNQLIIYPLPIIPYSHPSLNFPSDCGLVPKPRPLPPNYFFILFLYIKCMEEIQRLKTWFMLYSHNVRFQLIP